MRKVTWADIVAGNENKQQNKTKQQKPMLS